MIISPGIIESVIAGSPKVNGDSSVVSSENGEGTFGTLIQGAPVAAEQAPVTAPTVEGEAPPVVGNTENSKQIKTLLNKLNGLIKAEASNPKSILTALLKLSAEITANPAGQTGEIKTISDLEKALGTLPVGEAVVDNSETQKMLADLVRNVEAIFSHVIAMAEAMKADNAGDIKTKLTAISTELKEQVDQILHSEGKEVKVDLSKIKVILQEPQIEAKPVIETKEPVVTQAQQAPVQETKEPVETQAQQAPAQETKEPVIATEKPVVKNEEPVETQAQQAPAQETKEPVVSTEEPVKTEPVEPKQIDLSQNKEIKQALESLVAKIVDKIQTQNVDTQETKVDITTTDTGNTQNADLELQNIMEQLQVLVQPAAQETNNNVEVKIMPALAQTQLTQNEIKVVLNKVKALLSQQLNQAQQGTPMDMQKVTEKIKADLDGVLGTINNAIENKEVQITIPKLIKQLTEAIGEKTLEVPQPKKALNLEPQKINTDTQAEIKEPVVHQSRKDPLSQLDRTLNISKVVVGENKLNKAANQLLGRLSPDKDMIIERTLPEKIKDVRPTPDHNIDFSGKNAINSLFSKNNDPALAGIKFNNSSAITNNSINNLTNVSSTMNTGKPDSVANQVMDAVRNNFNKNQITVSLKPYNLGNVNVNVSLEKGALVAHMVTETTKAAESLKNGINSLKQALAEAGLNVDKVIVMQADKGNAANNNTNNDNQQTHKDHNLNNQAQDQQQQGASKGADLSQDHKSDNKSEMKSLVGGNDNNTSTENTTESANQAEGNYINTEKGLINYRV